MKIRVLATACFVLSLATPLVAQDGGPLAAARDLYASARYDEALAVLNGMHPDDTNAERKSIEQYRSLCLLALGRGPEAEAAIAAVVNVDPMFQPTESEASPRVRSAFTDVRQRLLPDIVANRYAAAKTAYDRKDFVSAEQQFRQVVQLLDDPQLAGKLGDLRTLATGFLDLSKAAAAPPPPKVEPKPEPPPPPPAPVKSIYSAEDPEATPPAIIRQDVPSVQPSLTNQARDRGLLELVIDEQGRVTGITLRRTIHPLYDQLLTTAARDWRYKPATVDGKPVKFKKLIQINVQKRDE
jgi:tetratricopeptide (TPR) repeat protein